MSKKHEHILILSPLDHINDTKDATRQDIYSRILFFQEKKIAHTLIEWSEDISSEQQDEYQNTKVIRIPRNKKGYIRHYRRRGLDSRIAMENIINVIEEKNVTHLWCEYDFFVPLARKVKKKYPSIAVAIRSHNYEIGHSKEKFHFKKKSFVSRLHQLIQIYDLHRMTKLMRTIPDIIFSISPLDARMYKEVYQCQNVFNLPMSMEYPSKQSYDSITDSLQAIYLSSTLSNDINKSGLDWIISLPLLEKNNIQIHLTGSDLSEIVPSYITYHGFVNNLEELFEQIDIGIVPVSIGYGMKGKAYELLMRGFPVIMTTRNHHVFEGIPGKTYLVADTVDEWMAAFETLRDEEIRKNMGREARSFMLDNFGQKYMIGQLERFISI